MMNHQNQDHSRWKMEGITDDDFSKTDSQSRRIIQKTASSGLLKTSSCKKRQRVVVDPYQVLKIRRDATNSEIRYAYKRMALLNHPGRICSSEEERLRRLQIFEIVAACYETLTHKETRRKCNELLHELEYQQLTGKLPEGDIRLGGKQVKVYEEKKEGLEESSSSASVVSSNSSTTTPSTGSIGNSSKPIKVRRPKRPHELDHEGRTLTCGLESLDDFGEIPGLMHSSSTATSMEAGGGDIHYTKQATDQLFGGPLQLMFKARRWEAFTDAFLVFSKVFGSEVDLGRHHNLPRKVATTHSRDQLFVTRQQPSPQNDGWKGNSRTLPDGSVVFTTTRTLPERKLVRTEVVKTDPVTGIKHSYVTVTSEPLDDNVAQDDPHACIAILFCGHHSTMPDEEEDGTIQDFFCGAPWFPDCR